MHKPGPEALLPWRDALAQVLDRARPMATESVPTSARACGQVLAAAIECAWDLPQDRTSMMDGYAVRTQELRAATAGVATFELAGQSAAGHPAAGRLGEGQAVRIFTGAVLPLGSDVVVPQEDVTRAGARLHVNLDRFGPVEVGRWTRAAGCDFARGDEALAAGSLLGPGDLALAASVGAANIVVHRRPKVAILSTGDELVQLGVRPAPGQVVSSNAIMLDAAVGSAGAVALDLGIAKDNRTTLREALVRCLEADVVLTSGGISVGDHDLVREMLEDLGCGFVFHGVNLRPGKPLAYAQRGQTHVIALPGNPASSLVGFSLFVRPLLRRLLGLRGTVTPTETTVTLRNTARGAGKRAHLLRARLHPDGTATALTSQISGNLASIRDFDALIEVPPGLAEIPAGVPATAVVTEPWWRERREM